MQFSIGCHSFSHFCCHSYSVRLNSTYCSYRYPQFYQIIVLSDFASVWQMTIHAFHVTYVSSSTVFTNDGIPFLVSSESFTSIESMCRTTYQIPTCHILQNDEHWLLNCTVSNQGHHIGMAGNTLHNSNFGNKFIHFLIIVVFYSELNGILYTQWENCGAKVFHKKWTKVINSNRISEILMIPWN